jgi:3-mercaptopyruvate sulfurtransferase SseA
MRSYPMTEAEWQERAKGVLKAELKRRGVSYKQLADKLKEIGIEQNDRNIANKLARGGFSAVFLLQCLEVIGCQTLHLQPQ